jgi:hypothetical protein
MTHESRQKLCLLRLLPAVHLLGFQAWHLQCSTKPLRERHYARSRKVAGSIPDEVIGLFFNLPNPSSCTVALKSSQPRSEMSIRNLPGSKERQARKSDNLTAVCVSRLSRKCGSLDVSQNALCQLAVSSIFVENGVGRKPSYECLSNIHSFSNRFYSLYFCCGLIISFIFFFSFHIFLRLCLSSARVRSLPQVFVMSP